MRVRKFPVLSPEGDGAAGGGDAGAAGDAGAGVGGDAAGAAAAAGGDPASGAPAAGSGEGSAAGGVAGAGAGAPAGDPAAGDPPGDWNPKWRELMAGDDEKALKQLQRLSSPLEVWKKARSLETRLSSGELKPVLGKNATPEQVKEYREAWGIPESPDKYDLGKDFNLDGINKDLLGVLFKEAHASNQTPDQVRATLQGWQAIQQTLTENRHSKDVEAQKAGEDALRAEWGAEYRQNVNLIHGMLDGTAAPGLRERILGGRLADGTPIGSDPDALKWLVSLALIQNPAGVVVPNGNADPMKGVEDEITQIETTMKNNRAAYNKDEKMQARYRELLGVRETIKSRKAA